MKPYQDYYAFYNSDDLRRLGRAEMQAELHLTREWLRKLDSQPNWTVVELGCGLGALIGVHPNYIGVDLSFSALKRITSITRRINADMQTLPLKNESVDFIFSWAALEHVPNPALALAEVERILKPGGAALLAPAWNVRSWATKALPSRQYKELSLQEKVDKATIPIRNSLVWRGICVLPYRFCRELSLFLGNLINFQYRRLSPHLADYVYTDSDAFTSIDPHAAITYFLSRSWDILSHPTFITRFFSRHEPVVVRKPLAPISS